MQKQVSINFKFSSKSIYLLTFGLCPRLWPVIGLLLVGLFSWGLTVAVTLAVLFTVAVTLALALGFFCFWVELSLSLLLG